MRHRFLPRWGWFLLGTASFSFGVGFWLWVETIRPPRSWQDVVAFESGFGAYRLDSIVPQSFQEKARQLGINPEPERRKKRAEQSGMNPNQFAIWAEATARTIEELASAERRYLFFAEYRVPIAVAALACTLLFLALALQGTKNHPEVISTSETSMQETHGG
jgi:hypothetical protein